MKRINRVRKHEEFSKIIHDGHRLKSDRFLVSYVRKDEPLTRIGISVSKKNGNAVRRNLIKRQIRAAIAEGCRLDLRLDIVIVVRPSYDTAKYREEADELISLIARIGEAN